MNQPRPVLLVALGALTIIFLAAAIIIFSRGQDNGNGLTPQPLPIGQAPRALRLVTPNAGITSISATEVRDVGLVFESFSAEGLNLTYQGEQVPFTIMGEGREATLYFYAHGITNTLTAPPVYWLSPGKGMEMAVESAATDQSGQNIGYQNGLWEENRVFLAQAEGEDLWLGQLLFAPTSLAIDLDGILPTGGPAELTVRIWSNNESPVNPDHHVEISLNGETLADEYWEGIREKVISVQVPAGVLLEEENQLVITAPGDTGAPAEQLFLDWIQLEFESVLDTSEGPIAFTTDAETIEVRGVDNEALIFDISDQENPRLLTGYSVSRGRTNFTGTSPGSAYFVLNPAQANQATVSLVPAWESLTDSGRGADYVAIVGEQEGFDDALQPLLDHRRNIGLSVESIPVRQVFDEFGHGRQTPEAIRDFLRYAAANWNPAPRFVLLVGDANYDIYGHVDGKNLDLVPTFLVNTRFAGYVASDTWFTVMEDGALAPDLAIGRFPAQTATQLATMVGKTIAYETTSGPQWNGKALLVADDETIFNTASDQLAGSLADTGYVTTKLYMSENDDTAYNHDAIVSAINEGVGIINYVGHGSIEVWGDEKVFQADDASKLANRERLPIFTTFTCLNGYFNHPQVDALAETLLWAESGGIVAAVAPSGRTTTSQQVPIAGEFYSSLLSEEVRTLGEALQRAKVAASDDSSLQDVIHTFNLLGDPALLFQLPIDDA